MYNNLKREFPEQPLEPIHKGSLNKTSIQNFLEKLIKEKEVFNNKYFRFFLLASDEKFFRKKDSDLNWVNRLSKKFSKDTEYKTKQLNLQLELETKLEKNSNGGELRARLDTKNSNFVDLKYFLSKLDQVSQEGYLQSIELVDLIQEVTKQQNLLAQVTKKFVKKLKLFNSKIIDMEIIASANLSESIKLSKMFDMIAKTMQKQSLNHQKTATILGEHFFKNLKIIEKDYTNFKEVSLTILTLQLFKLKQSIGSKARKEVLKEVNIQASANDPKINNEKLQKLNTKIAQEFIYRYNIQSLAIAKMSLNMSDELSCSTKLDGHIWTDLYAGVKSLTKNKQHLFESTI